MTAPNAELLALAERVEAGSGEERKLDGAIDRLFHERPRNGDYCPRESAIWRVDADRGLLVRGDGCARDSFCARSYTSSLNDAMTLASGKRVVLNIAEDGITTAIVDGTQGCAATPARALTAACLRAIAAGAR